MILEVSKRYAQALFEYAKETNKTDAIQDQLSQLAMALESSAEVREFIVSPIMSSEEKIAALKKALGPSAAVEIVNLVGVLVEKNRIDLVAQVAQAYSQITDETKGVTRGQVRYAAQLNEDGRKKIETTVAEIIKKQVILNYVEDKTIMGGLVAQVGGWTFDDSLQSHLVRMSEELTRGV